MIRPGVFLDRDGVLVESLAHSGGPPRAAASLAECRLLPGVGEALARLKAAGLPLVVVTNQPDVRRGDISRESVEEIHRYLLATLPLDRIEVCYHVDADNCDCRKPKAGMLRAAADALGLEIGRASCRERV